MNSNIVTVDENNHLENLNLKIQKFLKDEDKADLLIIKSHLLCEYYLNQILVLEDKCEGGKLDDLTFSQKLEKALNSDSSFDSKTKKIVSKLNSIRNKVGHELEYQLSESDLDRLGFVIGKEYLVEKYKQKEDIGKLKYCLRTAISRLAVAVNILVDDLQEKDK